MTRGRGVLLTLLALALVPALGLSLARVVQPGSSLGVQATSFTPYALVIYAVVLLGAVLLLARGDRPRPVRAALPVALVALAGVVLHAVWFAPMLVDRAPRPDGDDRWVVMTANLLAGEADPATLLDLVREHDVDVLVANEITPGFVGDLTDLGVDEELPFRAGDAVEGVEGTMVFAREETRVVEQLPTQLGSLVVEVGDVTLMAVHPGSPLYIDDWHADLRTVREAAREHRPTVIAGDFNATLDHAPLRAVLDVGFRDAAELTGSWHPTWPANGEFPLLRLFPPLVPIDHVLLDDSLTATDVRTADLPGTDHRPVIATLAPAP